MSNGLTVDEILEFAIDSEQSAVDLYMGLAAQAKSSGIKKTFEEYAQEERGHKSKLQEVKAGKRFFSSSEPPVLDLKISDYTVDKEPGPDADYQTVLLFAMKKEKAAFRLYSALAEKTDDAAIKDLLLGLAQEEAKHKLRFEVEYDEIILVEN
ncbi:MAG: ferritin family protein [Proteobacteria bacterium]|nr:ferritin family protein [Pseudomonadota bacterium]